jgi:aldehyde dehydrogenase (NAD+)
VISDGIDLEVAGRTLANAECSPSGQVCSSLTRIVVPRHRHDAMVEALAGAFSQVRVGGPFDDQTQIGPLVASRQSDGVESRIVKGIYEGATLATGGGRPKDLRKMSVLMPRSLAAWIIRNVGVLGP